MQRWIFLTVLISLLSLPGLAANAQEEETEAGSGAICALAYEDTNQNGRRDSGEMPLPGISVNLANEGGIIFSTYITTDDPAVYCFENLSANDYQLIFADSANHQATTENSIILSLSEGEQVRVDFGALPQDPFLSAVEAAELRQTEDNRLSTTTRVLLALAGAVIVMIFMIGFGSVIVSVIY